ncbi:unnamed protein product, partial [Mesorhabditis belari]|uniref:Uncharacterized protein n=1 Tax=Mesorhabditis belari TaxID=2138241 RepID=A0AAF3FK60_9BILA
MYRFETTDANWKDILMEASLHDDKPMWVYVIFRKNHCSGHEKMTVNISFDGPVFWNRQVAYLYCCSCHFEIHEASFMAILHKFEARVERVCLVDSPVDYAFLPDSLFAYMARSMPRLQFIYMRELDLEKINRGTVVELAAHKNLKKVIVHKCRNYEVLEDFRNLPQLLVVKGEIQGLKAMLGGDVENAPMDSCPSSLTTSTSTTSDSSELSDRFQQVSVSQSP